MRIETGGTAGGLLKRPEEIRLPFPVFAGRDISSVPNATDSDLFQMDENAK